MISIKKKGKLQSFKGFDVLATQSLANGLHIY